MAVSGVNDDAVAPHPELHPLRTRAGHEAEEGYGHFTRPGQEDQIEIETKAFENEEPWGSVREGKMASWAGQPSIKGSSESMRMALLTFSLVGLQ